VGLRGAFRADGSSGKTIPTNAKNDTRMLHDNVPASLFEGLFEKQLVAVFDAEQRTSNAGIPLLAALDHKLGLTKSLVACFVDPRDSSRIEHTYDSLFRQRVFSIALGCPDGNDAAHLGHDPALLTACGQRPDAARGLGSQPTLSRFEHSITGRELVNAGRALEDVVVQRLRKRHARARRIFIDLDPTVDPTHGQQAFAYFNGHYDTWCYLPMMGFLSIDGEPEQHLFHARLRAGTVKEVKGTPAMLRRIVGKLRIAFKSAKLCVRLDAGFACPQILDLLDELKVEYMVAMGGNAVLGRLSGRHVNAAASLTSRFNTTTTFYGSDEYRAKSWAHKRRVIFKAEVVQAEGKSDRKNDRYVITNLPQSAGHIWKLYCQRGDSENRIKELKRDLAIDRTSCTRFLPNQLRVLMTAAAFVLFQELRCCLADTSLRRAMVSTLRLRLLKVGATITRSARRIVMSMPTSHPWKDLWRLAAERVVAIA